MYLVVGLGNPGSSYENTRHNAGFCAIDAIANDLPFKKELKALTCKTKIGKEDVLLAKPETYMNLSGEAVLAIMSWYKIKPEQIIVFSDDVNLDLGRIRIRKKGSHGGQNGLRNIIFHIGENFIRIRLGVGKCPPERDLANFVLSKFSKAEKETFLNTANKAPEILETLFTKGVDSCMEKFNGPSK